MTVKWSQIESECGDYRAGFVATFRKYEGQPTDEKDAQGRTVKVTAASFARHLGIDKQVFARWIRKVEHNPPAPSQEPEQADKRKARSLVRTASETVVDAIMDEMPPERQSELVRKLVKNSPKTAMAASDALDETHDEWKATRPTKAEQTEETARDQHIEATTLLVKLRVAHRNLAEAASLSQNIRGTGEDQMRSAVLSEIEWIRGVCEVIEAGVNGGPLDSQLQALLDAEAGR